MALVLAVVALDPAWLRCDRLAYLANKLNRAFVEADHRAFRIGRFAIEVEHVLHPRDVLGIDPGNAPHLLAPRLQVVFRQASAYRFSRDAGMRGEADQFPRQKLQSPTGTPGGRARAG